jgi:phosphoglycolate phosphatase/pyrophosphatase PpaX
MLKYPCLILDHDDTVVQSEATVNYPFFIDFLKEYRPGMTITEHEYISGCFHPGYIEMCRQRFGFTDEELLIEYAGWKEYIRSHIPAPYPGIGDLIRRYKAAGGIICVVSQSAQENILRDYRTHFGIEPDEVYGWDLEPAHRKPSPWALQQVMAKYGFSPAQLLVVDDMKPAVQMAKAAGAPIAFAGWGRKEYPEICGQMSSLCDFTFGQISELEAFLFEA